MQYDWNTYLISIFSCCVVVWCVPKQCYMNIHERHFCILGWFNFCELQPATEMDPLQLTFLYLKMNQDIFFYVLWLKYTLNIYISCCVVVWCVTKQCYEHSWETLFVFWDDLIFVNSSRQQKWTNYN